MKKILFSAMISSLLVMFACNDQGKSDASNTTADSDTNNAVADTNAPANNIVTKTGLPLGPDQEVPPNNSSAKGTADVTYNKEIKMLRYTVNYSGLSDKASMAHIHGTAARGANAGVVHDLTPILQKDVSGSFTDSVKLDGALKEDSLLSGFYYFNIHTPKNPAGEIRGQIEF